MFTMLFTMQATVMQGVKTIAINLPNDPEIHVAIGSRKLQLKNAMQAKFEKILVPISKMLIDESQQKAYHL